MSPRRAGLGGLANPFANAQSLAKQAEMMRTIHSKQKHARINIMRQEVSDADPNDTAALELYSDANLIKREALRRAPQIVSVISAWWSDAHTQNQMRKRAYFAAFLPIYFRLVPSGNASDARDALENDWKHDSKGRGMLDEEGFFFCVYALADMWCATCEEEEYIDFLEELRKLSIRQRAQMMASLKTTMKGIEDEDEGVQGWGEAEDHTDTAGIATENLKVKSDEEFLRRQRTLRTRGNGNGNGNATAGTFLQASPPLQIDASHAVPLSPTPTNGKRTACPPIAVLPKASPPPRKKIPATKNPPSADKVKRLLHLPQKREKEREGETNHPKIFKNRKMPEASYQEDRWLPGALSGRLSGMLSGDSAETTEHRRMAYTILADPNAPPGLRMQAEAYLRNTLASIEDIDLLSEKMAQMVSRGRTITTTTSPSTKLQQASLRRAVQLTVSRHNQYCEEPNRLALPEFSQAVPSDTSPLPQRGVIPLVDDGVSIPATAHPCHPQDTHSNVKEEGIGASAESLLSGAVVSMVRGGDSGVQTVVETNEKSVVSCGDVPAEPLELPVEEAGPEVEVRTFVLGSGLKLTPLQSIDVVQMSALPKQKPKKRLQQPHRKQKKGTHGRPAAELFSYEGYDEGTRHAVPLKDYFQPHPHCHSKEERTLEDISGARDLRAQWRKRARREGMTSKQFCMRYSVEHADFIQWLEGASVHAVSKQIWETVSRYLFEEQTLVNRWCARAREKGITLQHFVKQNGLEVGRFVQWMKTGVTGCRAIHDAVWGFVLARRDPVQCASPRFQNRDGLPACKQAALTSPPASPSAKRQRDKKKLSERNIENVILLHRASTPCSFSSLKDLVANKDMVRQALCPEQSV